jgi:spore coat polysaccharide biosynthesis protein SpsF (cytidylyltransferase family)
LIPLHVDEDLPLRCTLDTTADWLLLQNIYQNWYLERIETDFTYIELINFLRTQPNMLRSMDKEIKNNSK